MIAIMYRGVGVNVIVSVGPIFISVEFHLDCSILITPNKPVRRIFACFISAVFYLSHRFSTLKMFRSVFFLI